MILLTQDVKTRMKVVILKVRMKILFSNLLWPVSRFLILTSMIVTMSQMFWVLALAWFISGCERQSNLKIF